MDKHEQVARDLAMHAEGSWPSGMTQAVAAALLQCEADTIRRCAEVAGDDRADDSGEFTRLGRRLAKAALLDKAEERDRLLTLLSDPAAVWVNMLHGQIAKPVAIASLEEERGQLRAALIMAGRFAGALVANDASTDFLTMVPEEVRLKIEAAEAERDRLKSELDEAKHEVDVFADSNAEFTRILDRLADGLAIPPDQEFSMGHANDLLAERDRLAAENVTLLGYLAAIRDMIGAWPPTDANQHGYAMSYPEGVIDLVKAERDRLAERVRELEKENRLLDLDADAKMESIAFQFARAERAESELTALRATIAAGEPFDADEIEAMQIAGLKGELAAARRALAWVVGNNGGCGLPAVGDRLGYRPHAPAITKAVEEDRARVAKVGR